MRIFYQFFLLLISLSSASLSQIPNNGFENWNQVGNCEDPDAWYSTNLIDTTIPFCPISRSSDHYPSSFGDFSIRLENNPALLPSFRGFGVIMTTHLDGTDRPLFPIIGHPNSLCGYYKFDCLNGDTMSINIYMYSNSTELANGHFMVHSGAPNWTPFVLPISSYITADSARITILSCNVEGAGAQGNSVLYVDNLSFDTLIVDRVNDPEVNNPLALFPNPAGEWLNLSLDNFSGHLGYVEVIDISGRKVLALNVCESTSHLNISQLEMGSYFVKVTTSQAQEFIRQLVICKR